MKEFILVSPDAGANKKIYKLVEQIGYKGDILTCSKQRSLDLDGKITKTVVPRFELEKDAIIIDDICDGGATFIKIAEVIKENQKGVKNPGKIYLIVTHGIFSKGFEELSKYFNEIYCTNSYREIDSEARNIKLKQLNLFN